MVKFSWYSSEQLSGDGGLYLIEHYYSHYSSLYIPNIKKLGDPFLFPIKIFSEKKTLKLNFWQIPITKARRDGSQYLIKVSESQYYTETFDLNL